MGILSQPKPPSERTFGVTLSIALAVAGVRGAMKHWNGAACLALVAIAIAFAAFAIAAPKLLAPLNKAWFLLGLAIGRVVNPVVMGIIFFLIITPISLFTRLFRRDALRLKQVAADTYWVDRLVSEPDPESFKNQY